MGALEKHLAPIRALPRDAAGNFVVSPTALSGFLRAAALAGAAAVMDPEPAAVPRNQL